MVDSTNPFVSKTPGRGYLISEFHLRLLDVKMFEGSLRVEICVILHIFRGCHYGCRGTQTRSDIL